MMIDIYTKLSLVQLCAPIRLTFLALQMPLAANSNMTSMTMATRLFSLFALAFTKAQSEINLPFKKCSLWIVQNFSNKMTASSRIAELGQF